MARCLTDRHGGGGLGGDVKTLVHRRGGGGARARARPRARASSSSSSSSPHTPPPYSGTRYGPTTVPIALDPDEAVPFSAASQPVNLLTQGLLAVYSASLPSETSLSIENTGDRASTALRFWETIAGVDQNNDKEKRVVAFPNAKRQWLLELCEQVNWGRTEPAAKLVPRGTLGTDAAITIAPPQISRSQDVITTNEAEALASCKAWVSDVLVDKNVCPFTASPDYAAVGVKGVEPGAVLWQISDAGDSVHALNAFWQIARDLACAPDSKSSAAMLLLPCYDDDFERFDVLCEQIEGAVVSSHVFLSLQAIFFHPQYSTPETLRYGHHHPPALMRESYTRLYNEKNEKKKSISLETARRAADFSRRMPNACINLLKSHQVATAEEQAGGSWRIYAANLKRLSADGV